MQCLWREIRQCRYDVDKQETQSHNSSGKMKQLMKRRATVLCPVALVLFCVSALPFLLSSGSLAPSMGDHLLDFATTASTRSGLPTYESSGNKIAKGILTIKPVSFFRRIQQEIDDRDAPSRCAMYNFPYDVAKRKKRRIFYGSLIASEPWELFELVSAEAYGIFSAIVFVESNRTQDKTPRGFHRLNHTSEMRQLFGGQAAIRIRPFISEDMQLEGLNREHEQRQEIIKGWIELGMQADDVGILADADETFHRDFLRAIQTCEVPHLLYEQHQCHHLYVKLRGHTQVFETTPECPRDDGSKTWFHPDLMIGACIQGIANVLEHPPAPRQSNSFMRSPGFGSKCNDFKDQVAMITDARFPAWDAADFRRTCGGSAVYLDTGKNPDHSAFTAFHFHNFLSDLNATRTKHFTYGHPNKKAFEHPLQELGEDYQMMARCVKGLPETDDQKFKRSPGGFVGLKPHLPVYFQDEDYRRRRHNHVLHAVETDESIHGSVK